MPSPAPLIMFDCDGTLVDSAGLIVAAMDRAAVSSGLAPQSAEAVRRVVGLSLGDAVAALFPALLPPAVAALATAYKTAFTALRMEQQDGEPLYPGMVETIHALDRAGFLIGIATGKSRRGVDRLLALHGLGTFVMTIQTPDDGPGKPDPRMLHAAMADCGAIPETTVMVGDTTYDMEMARRAGARAIGVSWGYHGIEELTASGAHAIVDEAHLLEPAVTGFFRGFRPGVGP